MKSLSPLGMGSELGMRPGVVSWGNGGRGADLQLAYLFSWSEWSVGSQGAHTGIWVWDKAMG